MGIFLYEAIVLLLQDETYLYNLLMPEATV